MLNICQAFVQISEIVPSTNHVLGISTKLDHPIIKKYICSR